MGVACGLGPSMETPDTPHRSPHTQLCKSEAAWRSGQSAPAQSTGLPVPPGPEEETR